MAQNPTRELGINTPKKCFVLFHPKDFFFFVKEKKRKVIFFFSFFLTSNADCVPLDNQSANRKKKKKGGSKQSPHFSVAEPEQETGSVGSSATARSSPTNLQPTTALSAPPSGDTTGLKKRGEERETGGRKEGRRMLGSVEGEREMGEICRRVGEEAHNPESRRCD